MNEETAHGRPIGNLCHLLLMAFLSLAASGVSQAGEWPGWRGPTGLGYSDEKDLPLTWDGKSGENILWKTLLHGGKKDNPEFGSPGWSCPIVWGERVFLTTATWPIGLPEKERRAQIAEHHVLCFQVADGKLLWDTVVPAGKCLVNDFYHAYSTPTPVADGRHVFALFSSGVLASLDFNGKIIWREDLPLLKEVDRGVCSSPVLYQDTVIVAGIQELGLRALDKKTGKVKWEQQTKQRNTFATPALVSIGGKTQLIHYAGGMQGLDPRTGDLLWSCRIDSSHSSVAFGGGLLFADLGRGGLSGTAVDPTGTGEVTKTHIKWKAKVAGAEGSSPIIVGDYLYRSSNPGIIRCWKLSDGELMFEERAAQITPSASPVATADGRIYFASSKKTYVIQAGPEFKQLAVNDLDDSPDYSAAAVSRGKIFIKGKSYLWCIGK